MSHPAPAVWPLPSILIGATLPAPVRSIGCDPVAALGSGIRKRMVIPDQYTPPMQPASEGRKGAILCAEIQALIAIMRQNSKWALVPGYGYGDEDLPEDPLLEEFKILRRKVHRAGRSTCCGVGSGQTFLCPLTTRLMCDLKPARHNPKPVLKSGPRTVDVPGIMAVLWWPWAVTL